MKKTVFIFTLFLIAIQSANAEGVMDVSAQINSRMFSTQAAHQYETLEKEYYKNSAIRQIENRNYQPVTYTKQPQSIEDKETEKGGIKEFFKGFRVIY